ncbi:hypothetical protein HDC90_002149 [Pedobacter sp. AK013]|uniref:hypothetical protein n=1 Tax=Pedobacter sp. AK013 TaxID=2723071 RepID=UPI00161FC6F2|nr:hypothetical protein [Pedobacter sp. AK013]MBB6237527.1 hypothetical protein [Pedobacter sp. AK013]
MKNNNSYLPLFFLCWALLYSPLALLTVSAVGGSGPDLVAVEKPCAAQVSGSLGEEELKTNNFGCFVSVYGPAPGVWNCGQNFTVPFCLTDNPQAGYGTK